MSNPQENPDTETVSPAERASINRQPIFPFRKSSYLSAVVCSLSLLAFIPILAAILWGSIYLLAYTIFFFSSFWGFLVFGLIVLGIIGGATNNNGRGEGCGCLVYIIIWFSIFGAKGDDYYEILCANMKFSAGLLLG